MILHPENESAARAVDSPHHRRLPPLLRSAWFSLNQTFRRRIAPLEITPDQFTILRWLLEDRGKGLTQRELSDLMASDPNTITSLLNRMERSGLIQRKPHETDRRANRLYVRPQGRKIYEKARIIAIDLQMQIMDCLDPEDRERFLINLERISEACRNALNET